MSTIRRDLLRVVCILAPVLLPGTVTAATKATKSLTWLDSFDAPVAAVRPWSFRVGIYKAGSLDTTDNKTVVRVSVGTGATGSLGGTVQATSVHGIATFTVSYSVPETIYLTAGSTDTSIVPTAPAAVDVRNLQLAFEPQPAAAVVIGDVWPSFRVSTTLGGAPYAEQGTLVTLEVSSAATGSLLGTLTHPLVDGTVTFDDVSYDRAEPITITAATADPYIVEVVSSTVSAQYIELVYDPPLPSVLPAGEKWAPFTVRARFDGAPYDVSGIVVTLAASPGATLYGTRTVTLVGGAARFESVWASAADAATLTASVPDPRFSPAISGAIRVKNRMGFPISNPRREETGVPVRLRLRLAFDEPVNPATVRPDTVFVSGPQGVVPAQYAISGGNTILDLFVDGPLATQTTYAWTMTQDVTDAYGLGCRPTTPGAFTTENAGWGLMTQFNYSFSYGYLRNVVSFDVGYGANGDAAVVFETSGDLDFRWFNENPVGPYAHANSWDEITSMTRITGGGWNYRPSVAIDDRGNVLVTYTTTPWQMFPELRAVHYDALTGSWSAPVTLGHLFDSTQPTVLAMAGSGHAVAAWVEFTNAGTSTFQVSARYFVPGSGWSDREPVSGVMYQNIPDPIQAAIGDDGAAALAWNQPTPFPAYKDVYVAVRDPATADWSAVALGGHGTTLSPQIAVDAAGHALCVFPLSASDGGLASSWYDGSSWRPAVDATNYSGCRNPRLAMSPNGDATLAWVRTDTIGKFEVVTREFSGGVWQGGFCFFLRDSDVVDAVLARDDLGDVLLAFGSGGSVVTRRYVPGRDCGSEIVLGAGSRSSVAVNRYGNAMVTFGNGTDGWAMRYASGL